MSNLEEQKQKIRTEFNERITSEVGLAKKRAFVEAEKEKTKLSTTGNQRGFNYFFGVAMLEKAKRLQREEENILSAKDDFHKLLHFAIADAVHEAGKEIILKAVSETDLIEIEAAIETKYPQKVFMEP